MKQFSARLSQLISEHGRGSASSLARACGVDRAYISRLQHGAATAPSQDVIRKAAQFFGVNVGWLRDGIEPRLAAVSPSDNRVNEPSGRYGSASAPIVNNSNLATAPVNKLDEHELWELVQGYPFMIASAGNDTVRHRLASDAEAAAIELKTRISRQ